MPLDLIVQSHNTLAKIVRSVDVSHIPGSRYTKLCAILDILDADEYSTEFTGMIAIQNVNLIRWYRFLLIKLEPRIFINTTKHRFSDDVRLEKYQLLYALFVDIENYFQSQ